MKNIKRNIREYVLKNQPIFVGLEDSKRSWKICVRSDNMTVHETSMPADYEILHNYFTNKFPNCKINVIYEAGFRGFGLADQIHADGWKCIVTPPHTVTEEKCNRQKNDRIDCRRLAKVLETNDYKSCHIPNKKLREDRQISRLYSQNQKDIIRERNRIRRALEFHGLDNQFKPGRWGSKQYKEAWEKINNMDDISASLRFSLESNFAKLGQLLEYKKLITNKLMQLAKSEYYKETVELVKSVPGIGVFTSIRLILEIGDMSRFKRKEELSSFLGLIPSDYSTGEKERKGHITKQGNRALRSWLIESSWIAIRKDPVLFDKYRRVFNNNGRQSKKAIVAVAKKLAMRVRAVILTQQSYMVGVIE